MRQPDNRTKFQSVSLAGDVHRRIGIVRQLRDCLKKIAGSGLVQRDAKAQLILWRMARSGSMLAVNEEMDRLAVRVGELLAAKTGDPAALTRLVAAVRQNDPAAQARLAKQHAFNTEEEGQRRRVFVRL